MAKNIKITKRQLKEDEFVGAVFNSTTYIREHLQVILIVVVALVVSVGGYVLFSKYQESNQKKANLLHVEARKSYTDNKLDEALKQFETLADDYSGTESGKEALIYIGNIYFQQGQYDKANEAFKRCQRKYSKDDVLHISALEGLAACLEGQQKYAEAAKEYEKISDTYGNKAVSPRNLMAAMRAYEAANDVASAKRICQLIIDKYAESPEKTTAQNKLTSYDLMAKVN